MMPSGKSGKEQKLKENAKIFQLPAPRGTRYKPLEAMELQSTLTKYNSTLFVLHIPFIAKHFWSFLKIV
jgi:hypothetical protein